MDRNSEREVVDLSLLEVALHPEGVDRNLNIKSPFLWTNVALHPEGVDRNPASTTL